MLASQIPVKIPVIWASTPDAGTIRTVPVPSQEGITPGAASFTTGFPLLTATQVAAGGIPPNISDVNGILNPITAWLNWAQAGGPIAYDAAFSASVGGYPRGAVLNSTTLGAMWLNTTDNNTNNPDVTPTGWVNFFPQNISGNAGTASKLATPRSIALAGAVTGAAAFDGSGDIVINTSMATPVASITDPGYYIFPGGLIEQWGSVAIPSGSNTQTVSISFPIPFPAACFGVYGNADHNATISGWKPLTVMFPGQGLSGSSCTCDAANPATTMQSGIMVHWHAKGR